MWDGDYLKGHPVHDVSGLIEGQATRNAHTFVDELWKSSLHGHPISWQNGKLDRKMPPEPLPPLPELPEQQRQGPCRMLALGRLGNFVPELCNGSDAAVSARVLCLLMAKRNIRVSQQALGFEPAPNGGFDFMTTLALVAAAKEGVKVDIVVSSDRDMMGYNGHVTKTVAHLAQMYSMMHEHAQHVPRRHELQQWLHMKHDVAHDLKRHVGHHVLRRDGFKTHAEMEHFNAQISVAPIHFAPNTNYWQVGGTKKLAANHAKVYIVDESNFFVGSDNFYVSGTLHGLQEFGYLIEGEETTKSFIKEYWDNLWKNSSPFAEKASQKMFH